LVTKRTDQKSQEKKMRFWIGEVFGFLWSLPVTLAALVVWAFSGGHRCVVRYRGLRWAFVPKRWYLGSYIGFSLGAFVFFRDEHAGPQTWVHEDEHRRQWWYLGVLKVPLWLIGHSLSWLFTRDVYFYTQLELLARHAQIDMTRYKKFRTFELWI
jgi:hypothetical protein